MGFVQLRRLQRPSFPLQGHRFTWHASLPFAGTFFWWFDRRSQSPRVLFAKVPRMPLWIVVLAWPYHLSQNITSQRSFWKINFGRRNENITSHKIVRVARLQSEFLHADFFWATNFLTKNAPKFSPKFLSLSSVVQKKSRKIPAKLPTKFPCKKSKKIHRRASAGAQGEQIVLDFFLGAVILAGECEWFRTLVSGEVGLGEN